MHAVGFVIIPELTWAAVDAALLPFDQNNYDELSHPVSGKWDWWRICGRFDGYLVSEKEMQRRQTHNGFNSDSSNEQLERNYCVAKDIPAHRQNAYFFVVGDQWVDRDDSGQTPDSGQSRDFDEQLRNALAGHPDWFVVVIDAHM